MAWDTARDVIEHGSWFRGTIYPASSGLSPDGRWMIYMGINSAKASAWVAVCKPPALWPVVYWPTHNGTWTGGGAWLSDRELALDVFDEDLQDWPNDAVWSARDTEAAARLRSEVRVSSLRKLAWEDPYTARMRLEGFEVDANSVRTREILGRQRTFVDYSRDVVWRKRATLSGATLEVRHRSAESGVEPAREYVVMECHGLFDQHVTCATWDAGGRLLAARQGTIEAWTEADICAGCAGFRRELDTIEPPQGEDGRTEALAGAWGAVNTSVRRG